MTARQADVLVIGGGPAGATIARLLADRGRSVVLFERGEHPRFHIGESLLPMNLPILERLGVAAEVAAIGVEKRGADFAIANAGKAHQTFNFSDALGQHPDHAFEVRRAEFDELLYRHAQRGGVDARQRALVRSVQPAADGRSRVLVETDDGERQDWDAGFVVDASGRDAVMATQNGWKAKNQRHASAALFAHFRGVRRRDGEQQGNISIVSFEHGWVWMIPLRDDVMSIGAVCTPAYLRTRRVSLDEFLAGTLDAIGEVRERLEGASRINETQATGNYSYRATRKSGPGYLLIGDAYAFIDPVFSSGVYLAMSSAERALAVVDAWFSGNASRYRSACQRYSRDIDRGIAAFSWFIYRFTTPAMQYLLNNPRDVLGVSRGVTSMLAGDVFDNPAARRRLWLFKCLYAGASLVHWRQTRAQARARQDIEPAAAREGRLAG